jgi:ankyrin repeat protein
LARDPLYLACLYGHESIARLLLASEADSNTVDLVISRSLSHTYISLQQKNSLLHVAAISGRVEIITSLLTAGADLEAVNKVHGFSILMSQTQ